MFLQWSTYYLLLNEYCFLYRSPLFLYQRYLHGYRQGREKRDLSSEVVLAVHPNHRSSDAFHPAMFCSKFLNIPRRMPVDEEVRKR